MNIISFDIGKTSAYYDSENKIGDEFKITSLEKLEEQITEILTPRPDVVIYPHPVRYYNVMRKHWQYIAIINLVCEKKCITTVEVKDSQAKKSVIGSGKAKKPEIMAHYGEKSEHVADARMFCDWYLKETGGSDE